MTVTIREALPSDADALAGLLGELGYPTPPPDVPARMRRFGAEGNGRVLVAVVGEAVRAFAAVEITHPIHQRAPVAHLTAFAVSHTARRQGVGRRLLAAVEALAGDQGCAQVVVTSAEHRADAHAFYPAAGWGFTGRRFGKAIAAPERPSAPAPSPRPRRVVVARPRITDETEWARVLRVRDRYDPLAPTDPAHLTLVFPFEDAMSDGALEAHLRALLADIAAFDVTLAGITAHENEYLFLNVKRGNDAVVHLHDVLYSGALARHLVRAHTFVPHITVGRLPSRQLEAALQATADLTSPIRARIETLTAYRIEDGGTRTDLFDLPLDSARR